MPKNIKAHLLKTSKLVDKALNRYLPPSHQAPSIIHKAMRYSVFAGGKRIRPILVIEAARACGATATSVMPTACALELIHTYSLIHDDLPAMDNDDLRRGRPTNHKVFGDDIAILAGDALLTHAFFLLHKNTRLVKRGGRKIPWVLNILATGAGTQGMIGGQVADIKSDHGKWRRSPKLRKQLSGSRQPANLLNFIHAKKTAALIRTSLLAGAILAGGDNRKIKAINNFGKNIGMAFQVRDDVLDRIGNKKKLGKKGSDQTNQKLTYPLLYGLPKSKMLADQYTHKAYQDLKIFGKKGHILRDLAAYMVNRDH